MWGVVGLSGEVIATYTREDSALLNGKGLPVVQLPDDWTAPPPPEIAKGWQDRRRAAFGTLIETSEQFEAFMDALAALIEQAAPDPRFARFAALMERVAAIKAEYPKA